MKNTFKLMMGFCVVSFSVGFLCLFISQSQAAEINHPFKSTSTFNATNLKAQPLQSSNLKQPNYDYYDYIVVYPTLDVPNYKTVSLKLIRVDSQLGISSPGIVLYQTSNPSYYYFKDIRINKDFAGLTYITFEEAVGRIIPAFHEIVIPSLQSPKNFIHRIITFPPNIGGIVGCDQAINPTTIEQYYFCGVVVSYNNVPVPYLEIWLGKSQNFAVQPIWTKIYTVTQSGDVPSGIALFYDPKLNELLLRFQTNWFSKPPASQTIYEMSVDPQTLAIKNQPQIISGSNTVNSVGMPARYSPAIHAMSFPRQEPPAIGAHFQAKIAGAWQTLLSVADAVEVEIMGTVDSNLPPELFFLTTRLTWGGTYGANDITGYIFSGPPFYQSLQQVPIGQVNNPNQERYGFAATLKRRYSSNVPIAVLYADTSLNKQKILFSTGDTLTGIFTSLKAVHSIDQNKEIISPEQLAVETIP